LNLFICIDKISGMQQILRF